MRLSALDKLLFVTFLSITSRCSQLVTAESLDHHLLPPSSITSGFAWQGHQSCTDLLLQTYMLTCKHVAKGPEVRVRQCTDTAGAEGLFLLMSQQKAAHKDLHRYHHRYLKNPNVDTQKTVQQLSGSVPHNSSDLGHHRPHGHHVYRIRIVGSEVVVPPIQYCGSIAVAKYSLSFPGSYHVEVLHMYNNFTFDRPSPVRSSIRAVDFNLLVNESPSGSSKSASPGLQKLSTSEHPGMSYVACQGTQCPICEVHSMPGRWLTKTAVVAQQLLHTCVFVDAPGHCDRRKSKLSLDESRQMLEWQPYGCSYKVQTAAMLTACMGKLNMPVCFIGDSQTRHLHRMVTRALCSVNCTNECAVQDNQAANGTTVKSVAKSDNVVYIEDRWGSLIDTSGCSYVFWNFGQWPLSYMARTAEDPTNLSWGEKPWSLQHYMAYVTPLAKHMVLQAQKHSNLHYWVTINSHPLTRDQQDPESRYHDQRTPPMLLMYNKLATTIMNQHAIEVVDTFSIADPLLDLSYDGAHYLGAIGQMQAQLVLNVVCEQQLLPTAVFPRIIDP